MSLISCGSVVPLDRIWAHVGQAACDERGLVTWDRGQTTLCARDSTRAGGLHCRAGPQGQRVAAGMAKVACWHLLRSSVQARGGQICSIPRMDEAQVTRSEIVSRKPPAEIPRALARTGTIARREEQQAI